MPKCRDVMTREPVCCEPGDPIVRVAEVMKREDVGAVPVVDSKSSRRLVGMVTDRDIVMKVVAEGRSVQAASGRAGGPGGRLGPKLSRGFLRRRRRPDRVPSVRYDIFARHGIRAPSVWAPRNRACRRSRSCARQGVGDRGGHPSVAGGARTADAKESCWFGGG